MINWAAISKELLAECTVPHWAYKTPTCWRGMAQELFNEAVPGAHAAAPGAFNNVFDYERSLLVFQTAIELSYVAGEAGIKLKTPKEIRATVVALIDQMQGGQ